MLNDIRKPESERKWLIIERLKDDKGFYVGYLHIGEVVRCGECKYYDDEDYGEPTRYCTWHENVINADDYCSYGERKSDE